MRVHEGRHDRPPQGIAAAVARPPGSEAVKGGRDQWVRSGRCGLAALGVSATRGPTTVARTGPTRSTRRTGTSPFTYRRAVRAATSQEPGGRPAKVKARASRAGRATQLSREQGRRRRTGGRGGPKDRGSPIRQRPEPGGENGCGGRGGRGSRSCFSGGGDARPARPI